MASPLRVTSGLLLAALVALAACRGGSSPAGGAAASQRRYTVRGEVVTMPAPGASARQIALRHEAIPDFVDRDGKVVGMGSMVMPFDVSPDVPLDAIREGDPVEAVVAVDWSRPSLRIERLSKLPPGTPLKLGKD